MGDPITMGLLATAAAGAGTGAAAAAPVAATAALPAAAAAIPAAAGVGAAGAAGGGSTLLTNMALGAGIGSAMGGLLKKDSPTAPMPQPVNNYRGATATQFMPQKQLRFNDLMRRY